MNRYHALASLRRNPRAWLVTGVAGFIGSNLPECLLSLGQAVAGLDNGSTGHPRNVEEALERGGVLNVLVAARDAKVQRVVYASSSAVGVADETSQALVP
ncbi:MAG TPA: NAD-dependent epimerase/dehydratase family protein [Gemmatimonadaceae bacterium]|nr:NAD-dependent epimerase/dehydratase family protein [Gemmatimonadaceae bacterium]